jgi:hypothetical protein
MSFFIDKIKNATKRNIAFYVRLVERNLFIYDAAPEDTDIDTCLDFIRQSLLNVLEDREILELSLTHPEQLAAVDELVIFLRQIFQYLPHNQQIRQGVSIYSMLQANPQDFLYALVKCNLCTPVLEFTKLHNPLPLVSSNIPAYFEVDTHTLVNLCIFDTEDVGAGDYNKNHIFQHLGSYEVAIWEFLFNMRHRAFRWSNKVFNYSLSTDGYGCSLQFRTVESTARKVAKNERMKQGRANAREATAQEKQLTEAAGEIWSKEKEPNLRKRKLPQQVRTLRKKMKKSTSTSFLARLTMIQFCCNKMFFKDKL